MSSRSPLEFIIVRLDKVHVKEVMQIQSECQLSRWSEIDYQREILRDDSICLGITVKNELAGYIIMRLTTADDAEIYNIGVASKFRNSGAGRSLLSTAIKEAMAATEGKRHIWLEVRESNQSALSFYLKNGFTVIGLRKNFYLNPTENAILMKFEAN